MKKIILFITLGFTTILWANMPTPTLPKKDIETKRDIPSMQKHKQTKHKGHKAEKRHLKADQKQHMKKMDRELTKRKAMKRNFKTHDEFKKGKKHQSKKVHHKKNNKRMAKHFNGKKHTKNSKALKKSSRYSGYNDGYDNDGRDNYRDYKNKQNYRARGYRHFRQHWYQAYRYERASFYDRYGYYYGYFNRHGYLFEGDFYRYDRYYTYRDRLRGKGLFDYRYYRPVMDYYYSSFDDPYYRR